MDPKRRGGVAPEGGGVLQVPRAVDWGVVRMPDGVSFEEVWWVEPVNTCLKGIRQAHLQPGDTVLIQGQGPIGLLLLALAKREGCSVVVSDPMEERLAFAAKFGANVTLNPKKESVVERMKQLTENRGADAVLVAAPASSLVLEALEAVRPGAGA